MRLEQCLKFAEDSIRFSNQLRLKPAMEFLLLCMSKFAHISLCRFFCQTSTTSLANLFRGLVLSFSGCMQTGLSQELIQSTHPPLSLSASFLHIFTSHSPHHRTDNLKSAEASKQRECVRFQGFNTAGGPV